MIKLIPPALVLHTERGIKPGFEAAARGPVVFIRPVWRGNAGLLVHELEHVRQWWVTLGLHSILYLLSRRYRAWAEARAYAAQIDATDEAHWTVAKAAAVMARGYDLRMTDVQCAALIRRYIEIP